jgi:hypothetical protein
MIGGEDIIIETSDRRKPAVLDLVVRFIRRRWPHAVVQDGTSGNCFSSYAALPFGHIEELFVYRDERSFETWMRVGADVENANSMIHLLADETTLTLVVDDPGDPTMASVIEESRDALAPRNLWTAGLAA